MTASEVWQALAELSRALEKDYPSRRSLQHLIVEWSSQSQTGQTVMRWETQYLHLCLAELLDLMNQADQAQNAAPGFQQKPATENRADRRNNGAR